MYSMGVKSGGAQSLETPGPGGYDLPSKITESPGKSFGSRYKDENPTHLQAPGPGAYTHEKQKNKNLSYT